MKWRAALAGVVTVAIPAAAIACPACATRDSGGGATLALLAAMMAVPYGVAVVAIRVVRRLERNG